VEQGQFQSVEKILLVLMLKTFGKRSFARQLK
ncbi:MAG: hypothetical protein XD73_1251, partial [Anaerolinea thermophila]